MIWQRFSKLHKEDNVRFCSFGCVLRAHEFLCVHFTTDDSGITDITVVDSIGKDDERYKNLCDCRIADYYDRDEFRDLIVNNKLLGGVKTILHKGAFMDTMESYKGKMASMVYQLYRQLRDKRIARIFKCTNGYADGDQRRDIVFVEDVVKVNLFFADGPTCKGIVNCGTGVSRSFNDIANTIISLLNKGEIDYIPMPESIRGKYQSFTKADFSALRQIDYCEPFTSLEDGIKQCVKHWNA